MGRKLAQGIPYFPMDSNHTLNNKIRLLVNDAGEVGYWVWSCLLDDIYRLRGYYYDTTQADEFELFASEHCKKPLELVRQIIQHCLNRKLFDVDVFTQTGCLTSEHIQVNYLYGTYERRRKGAKCFLQNRLFLISAENIRNSAEKLCFNVWRVDGENVIPCNTGEIPRKNPEFPQINSQSRVYSTESTSYSQPGNNNDDGVSGSGENRPGEKENTPAAPPVDPPPCPPKKPENKRAPRKKSTPADTTPHWKELKEQFNQFIHTNYKQKYSWNTADFANFSKILKDLQARSEEQKKEWNITNAHLRFEAFLSVAFKDPHLRDNFEISKLYHHRNKIYLNGTGPNSHKSPANGHQEHNDRSGPGNGKQNKAERDLQELVSIPERVQKLADSLSKNQGS